MCMMCEGMTEREYWTYVRGRILEHGWFLQAVEGEDHRNPPFAYTVGLSRLGHPELIAFGMHPECAHAAVEPLVRQVLAGRRFDEGDDLTAVYDDLPPELLRFPDSSTHLFVANDLYRAPGRPPVPALQVFWPSEIGLLEGTHRRAGWG
jgi:hypothetical protein